ncbi:MAG: hypothetical protein R2867_37570 [Caldilineaceae bacterium]
MNDLQVDIAVSFKPQNVRSTVLYNVPLNTKRVAKMIVYPRIGEKFEVEIAQPQSAWLSLTRYGGIVPFSTTLIVDTTHLHAVSLYKEDLHFLVNGVEIHQEPIYLSTKLYDPNDQNVQLIHPFNLPKRKKNFLVTVLTWITVVSNFIVAFGALFVLLIVVLVIILIIALVFSG